MIKFKKTKFMMVLFAVCFLLLLSNKKIYASENVVEDGLEKLAIDVANEFIAKEGIEIDNIQSYKENSSVVEISCAGKDYGFIEFEKQNEKWIPVNFVLEEDMDFKTYLQGGEVSETTYRWAGSIFQDNVAKGLTYSSYSILPSICRISQSFIEGQTGKYACAVVALTEIAKQHYVLKNNSYADTFNELWQTTQTTVINVKDGITYGSTKDSMLIEGMRKYLTNRGYRLIASRILNPKYSYFQDAIDGGMSCTLSYRINTPSGKVGHTVNVFGWYIYKDPSGRQYKYLALADGWSSSIRYLLYDEIDFVDTCLVAYKIYR